MNLVLFYEGSLKTTTAGGHPRDPVTKVQSIIGGRNQTPPERVREMEMPLAEGQLAQRDATDRHPGGGGCGNGRSTRWW